MVSPLPKWKLLGPVLVALQFWILALSVAVAAADQ